MDGEKLFADLMSQAPVAGVFAFFAWLNFKQTVKTLDHYQNVFTISLGRILDQLSVLEERTRDLEPLANVDPSLKACPLLQSERKEKA